VQRLLHMKRLLGGVAGRRRQIQIALVALLLLVGVIALTVVVPPNLIDSQEIKDAEKRLAAENELRATLVGIMGGLAVLAGSVVAYLNLRETQRQNRRLIEVQMRGQVTDRFTNAIDQLGQQRNDKLDVRIGAIYALEQIARDSPELHVPVMEILTAFLREHSVSARGRSELPQAPDGTDSARRFRADLQAALTVIGRRTRNQRALEPDRLDLADAELPRARLAEAHLEHADLSGANLHGANLQEANLEGASLRGVNLMDANLRRANLRGASLWGADIHGARLWDADLEGATLVEADLRGADLGHANLGRANVERANLQGANLEGANLQEAYLGGANLRNTYLGGANLKDADLSNAHLDGADMTDPETDKSML
jgi:uncharacterized protein YjbI with pentapeptide repeats